MCLFLNLYLKYNMTFRYDTLTCTIFVSLLLDQWIKYTNNNDNNNNNKHFVLDS